MSDAKAEKKMKFNLAAIITEPGSTMKTKTGSWRTFKPNLDQKKCTKCGICWQYCPDMSIHKKEGKFIIDYDYCKGCLICMKVCPFDAISSQEEEK